MNRPDLSAIADQLIRLRGNRRVTKAALGSSVGVLIRYVDQLERERDQLVEAISRSQLGEVTQVAYKALGMVDLLIAALREIEQLPGERLDEAQLIASRALRGEA